MQDVINTLVGLDMTGTGRRIGEFIDSSGLTDKDLGEQMHLTVQSINKWRHGRCLPDLENLFILSRILNVKVDDFLVPVANGSQEITYDVEVGENPTSTFMRLRAYYDLISALIF